MSNCICHLEEMVDSVALALGIGPNSVNYEHKIDSLPTGKIALLTGKEVKI